MNGHSFSWVLASEQSSIPQVSARVLALAREVCADEGVLFAIRLGLEEAVRNAIIHGNRSCPERTVTVTGTVTAREIVITVEDQGEGFTPSQVPDPRLEENLPREGGRGVFLIRQMMDDVVYAGRGNKVTMTKRLPVRA